MIKTKELRTKLIEAIKELTLTPIDFKDFMKKADIMDYLLDEILETLHELDDEGIIKFKLIDNTLVAFIWDENIKPVETEVEYRIIGRFRKDEKCHLVDRDIKWTLEDAQKRLKELQMRSELEMAHKKRHSEQCGMISISTPYDRDYDLLDLRIQSREVTKWSDL